MLILFTVRDYSELDFSQLVRVYKSAFAEPPWDEFKKCCLCGINYGIKEIKNQLDQLKNCKNCLAPLKLTEFWSEEDIRRDLDYAFSQESCIVLSAESLGLLNGSTWGYKLPLTKFPFLDGKINADANYMDEIAVDANLQRQGIGKLLGLRYLERVVSWGISEVVLRTDRRNAASMGLFCSLGFKSLGITDPEFPFRLYLNRRLR